MMPSYARTVIEEVMPQVEKEYNVSKDRDERANAGLSMGGAEATFVGLNHLDKFAWICSMSGAYVMWPRADAPAPPGAPPPAGGRGAGGGRGGQSVDAATIEKNFPNLDAKANSDIRMLWIICGADDGLLGVNRSFEEWLKAKDVKFTSLEVPGYAHVWPLWRQNLTELAPLLFQAKK
jgi:enterochelin esterase family protein